MPNPWREHIPIAADEPVQTLTGISALKSFNRDWYPRPWPDPLRTPANAASPYLPWLKLQLASFTVHLHLSLGLEPTPHRLAGWHTTRGKLEDIIAYLQFDTALAKACSHAESLRHGKRSDWVDLGMRSKHALRNPVGLQWHAPSIPVVRNVMWYIVIRKGILLLRN